MPERKLRALYRIDALEGIVSLCALGQAYIAKIIPIEAVVTADLAVKAPCLKLESLMPCHAARCRDICDT